MNIIELEQIDSTNTYLRKIASETQSFTLVFAKEQTAGRGQRGNSWEAEPNKNLTLSLLWKPIDFPARNQFAVSEAVSLAIVDTLNHFNIAAKIKWPNDIYVDDNKICGILIEHSVAGKNIVDTIIGIGLNVNQTHFKSNAPNPISMAQIIGLECPLTEVLSVLANKIEYRLNKCSTTNYHQEYLDLLWRGDALYHPFTDANGINFSAIITGVDADGMLHLLTDTLEHRIFAFKEVSFRLKED